MEIFGDKRIKKAILDKLESISTLNELGSCIKENLESSDLQVLIYDEEQTRNDDFNKIKSLTLARGYCNNRENKIVLFNTRYETKESLAWVFFHEIGHLIFKGTIGLEILDQEYLVNKNIVKDTELYFRQESFKDVYYNDEVHENLPSELIANTIANYFIKKDYSRKWWRKNIKKIDRREQEKWKKILKR